MLGQDTDVSACASVLPPDGSCTARCRFDYSGTPTTYYCSSKAAGLQGRGPICASTTSTTVTITAAPALCSQGIPSGLGINSSSCAARYNGESCTVTCMGAYSGEAKAYYCNAGVLQPTRGEITCQKRQCNQGLPRGPYNTSSCGGRDVGQFCVVDCVAGYKRAPSIFFCRDDGWFEGSAKACVPLLCDPAGKPQGAGVNSSTCDGRVAGEVCNVTCAMGYQGTPQRVFCGLDGTFSGSAPICTRMRCVLPASLSNESITHTCSTGSSVLANGQSCTAGCADGYSGATVDLVCRAPDLVGSVPICKATKCSKKLPLGFGLDSSQCIGKATGETCTLACLHGYQAGTSASEAWALCQASGAFSQPQLSCERRPCTALADVVGFDATFLDASTCTDKVFGQGCAVACADGYDASGVKSQVFVCDASDNTMGAGGFVDASGTLASPALQCMPRACTVDLPRKRGLIHDCDGKRTDETCTVRNHPAFHYKDDQARTLVCGPWGAFLGSTPDVAASLCPVPSFPDGVSNTCSDRTIGTSCWTYCQAGWYGNMARYICGLTDNGTGLTLAAPWSTSVCTRSARRLALGSNPRRLAGACDGNATAAGLSTRSIKHDCLGKAIGELCIVECADGYNISGTPSIYTCSTGGYYTGPGLPTCVPQPCTTSFPAGFGVIHNCSGVVTDGTCIASCSTGYTGGTSRFICQGTAELNGTSPICQAAQCATLSLGPAYQATACEGKTTGRTCLVYCSDGWTINGSAGSYTCETTGNFSGMLPQCRPQVCTQGVPVGSDLSVASTCYALGTLQTCAVACASGYASNSSVLTCSAAGILQGVTPTCIPRLCTNLVSSLPGITHTCSNVGFGSVCNVGCKAGFAPRAGSSTQNWRCAWDNGTLGVALQGVWPLCDPLPCLYNFPQGAKVVSNCTGIATEGVCQSRCAPGYTGIPQTLTCGDDSTLHGNTPNCVAQRCPERHVPKVESTCTSAFFGDSCFGVCSQGYNGAAASWNCGLNNSDLLLGLTISLYGDPPSCAANTCIYNFPVGIAYAHTCADIITDGECTVQCAAPFVGTPQRFVCLSTGELNGSLPACVLPTSTQTTTSNAIVARISGNLTMLVSNQDAFIADPQVRMAVASSIATLADVPVSYVSVTLAFASRRLLSIARSLRRLTSVVVASYTIDLPPDPQVDMAVLVAGIRASIVNATIDQVQSLIIAQLDAVVGSGVYNVTVQQVSVPVFVNATADDGNGPGAVDEGASRAVPSGGSSGTGMSSATIALAAICALSMCCCCACGVYALEAWRKRRRVVPEAAHKGEHALDPILPMVAAPGGQGLAQPPLFSASPGAQAAPTPPRPVEAWKSTSAPSQSAPLLILTEAQPAGAPHARPTAGSQFAALVPQPPEAVEARAPSKSALPPLLQRAEAEPGAQGGMAWHGGGAASGPHSSAAHGGVPRPASSGLPPLSVLELDRHEPHVHGGRVGGLEASPLHVPVAQAPHSQLKLGLSPASPTHATRMESFGWDS